MKAMPRSARAAAHWRELSGVVVEVSMTMLRRDQAVGEEMIVIITMLGHNYTGPPLYRAITASGNTYIGP